MLKGIEDGHVENLILSGPRGAGKTVPAEEFSRICVKNGFRSKDSSSAKNIAILRSLPGRSSTAQGRQWSGFQKLLAA